MEVVAVHINFVSKPLLKFPLPFPASNPGCWFCLPGFLLPFQAVVPALSEVLQGFMMSGVVGVVCPELQDSLLKAFAEVDPPNSRVREDSLKLQLCMYV